MENENNKRLASVFEQIKYTDENVNEFWMALQLAKVVEYADFRSFISVLEMLRKLAKLAASKPVLPFKPFCRKSSKWRNTIN